MAGQNFLDVTQSVREQAWTARADEKKVAELEGRSALDPLTARLLAGRGVEPDDVELFLYPRLKTSLSNPSDMQDMDRAAALLWDAIDAGQKIVIFADYDVDGGTSAAQLMRWARHFKTEFGLYVPDRVQEGYGPSEMAFETLKAKGAALVITVDCGAAAHDALNAAYDMGLAVIVVDHHLMEAGQRPKAAALVNPNRADDRSELGHLAAAGVTFMYLVALNREARRRGHEDVPDLIDFLGLTALGTICDVVPLRGLNRAFVTQGLKVLGRDHMVGLKSLADIAGREAPYSVYDGGFVFGPRLNAGGRIGRSDMGAKLLSTDAIDEAMDYAAELDRVNKERRMMQDDILAQATQQADKLNQTHQIIVVAGEFWHPGIIGIVAGRLKDKFEKPVIIVAIDDEGVAKGSGRSIKGVNLGGAISDARKAGLLSSGGGHEMAGGLTTTSSKINALRDFLEEKLAAKIKTLRANRSMKIDTIIAAGAVNDTLMTIVDKVGPFGAGNPQPLFAMSDMQIVYAERLRGGHVRFTLSDRDGVQIRGICFRADDLGLADALLERGQGLYHVAGRFKRDNWQGRERIDFHLTDMALAS